MVRTISVRLPDHLAALVDRHAKAKGVMKSAVVQRISLLRALTCRPAFTQAAFLRLCAGIAPGPYLWPVPGSFDSPR
jgi:hypothetical protein